MEKSAPHELPAPQPQNHERTYEDSPKVADTGTLTGRSVSTCPVGGDGAICNSIQPVSTEKERKPDSADKPKSCWTSKDKGSCDIQPVDTEALGKPNDPKVIEKLFSTYEEKSRITLAASLAVGALIGLGIVFGSH